MSAQPTTFVFLFFLCLGSVLTANKLEFSSSSLAAAQMRSSRYEQTKLRTAPGMSQRRRPFLYFLYKKGDHIPRYFTTIRKNLITTAIN